MTENILCICALITLMVTVTAAFMAVLTGTIVYSWWRRLQVTKEQELPELLVKAIDSKLSHYLEPLKETLNEYGKPEIKPVKADPVLPLEGYNEWQILD